MRAALLATLLISPAFSADAPTPKTPLAMLTETFGEPGVEMLATRGLLILQGKPGARRLAAIHWKSLVALSHAADSCLALTAAADVLGHESVPSGPSLNIAACRALPMDGLMTPSLQALASTLQSGHEERWALHLASAAPLITAGRANLFDTSWGKDLSERHHADALENPAALAKTVFTEQIASPRPNTDAIALFAAEASARGAKNPRELIDRDSAKGTLSEELRAQLRRTISNERRRWAAERARVAAAQLLGKSNVKKELEDLRTAAKALSSRPKLAAAIEAAKSVSVAGGAHLKSAGLHLQEPTRLGQHELGDHVIVSGAYWVDGLGENESIQVEETLAIESERGFSSVDTHTHKRRNGGPYPFSLRRPITELRPFLIRSMISIEGSFLVERVEVPVTNDFELALLKESEAAGLRAACRQKDAEAAYLALEALVVEPAKVKPQYGALAQRARKAREATKTDNETLMKLVDSLASARADSAPQQCRYETKNVEAALKLAKRLPPGCDRDLPELHALHATITRRAVDQTWFMKTSAEARSKRKSCDLDGARARWSEALAVLETDPGARCGRVAEEEARVKTEFAALSRQIAWREALNKSLAEAETDPTPANRLKILRPVISRLGALDAKCFRSEQRRASSMSEKASKALTAPADDELIRRLPSDKARATIVSTLRNERQRRLVAATAAEKAAVEPPTAEEVVPPPPAAKTPAKKPVKKTKRKARRSTAK